MRRAGHTLSVTSHATGHATGTKRREPSASRSCRRGGTRNIRGICAKGAKDTAKGAKDTAKGASLEACRSTLSGKQGVASVRPGAKAWIAGRAINVIELAEPSTNRRRFDYRQGLPRP
eukprot:5834606-Prymnesium_polylepis.1